MDLAKYQELTGTTVSDEEAAKYKAVIRRTNSLMESALGYSLTPSLNLDKQERGKVQFNGLYPNYPLELDNLLPADDAQGSYRLFPYHERDIYLKTDPYLNCYSVKLVKPINDDEFVTYIDLVDFVSKKTRKFSKYVEKQYTWFRWSWYTSLVRNLGQDSGLLIAVDGDWLTCNNMPTDIQYLWADMVTYYASDEVSVTGNIKSESVNGHSWTKGAAGGGKGFSKNGGGLRGGDLAPEQSEGGAVIIAQYAGPNGTFATRIPTI